jgi:hypothetical protein
MKSFIKRHASEIAIVTSIWWGTGALISIIHQFGGINGREKCVYKSIGAFLNPGWIIACELYRERFEVMK